MIANTFELLLELSELQALIKSTFVTQPELHEGL